MNSKELIEALNAVAKEKDIDREIIFDAIETSLVTACKKEKTLQNTNIRVDMDRETGVIKVFSQKEIVEEVENEDEQITLLEVKQISKRKKYAVGDIFEQEVTPKDFGRISAQTAKQVVVQKLREAEREKQFNEFNTKLRDIVVGTVQKVDKKNVIVALGKLDAVLPLAEQIPGEVYKFNDRIKVYILDVKQTTKGPQVTVSRVHYEIVKRLFELEVPEVYDGTVEIKSVAREAGSRTKIAVYSQNPDVDPVGSCVGPNGSRVNVVKNELNGENIDIVNWHEEPEKYIAESLQPSSVVAVEIADNEEERIARVVVPDDQLSLAIGKEGQNVRLAARLTGWKIDIKSETQAKLNDFVDFDKSTINNSPQEGDEIDD